MFTFDSYVKAKWVPGGTDPLLLGGSLEELRRGSWAITLTNLLTNYKQYSIYLTNLLTH